MQKPNFVHNHLLMATQVGGASFPKIAKVFIDENCTLVIADGTPLSIIQTCEVGGPAKIQLFINDNCDVEIMPATTTNFISQTCLVTVSP